MSPRPENIVPLPRYTTAEMLDGIAWLGLILGTATLTEREFAREMSPRIPGPRAQRKAHLARLIALRRAALKKNPVHRDTSA